MSVSGATKGYEYSSGLFRLLRRSLSSWSLLHKQCYWPSSQYSHSIKSIQATYGSREQCSLYPLLLELLCLRNVKVVCLKITHSFEDQLLLQMSRRVCWSKHYSHRLTMDINHIISKTTFSVQNVFSSFFGDCIFH